VDFIENLVHFPLVKKFENLVWWHPFLELVVDLGWAQLVLRWVVGKLSRYVLGMQVNSVLPSHQ